MIAFSGERSKNRAPPPIKGSIYLLNFSGLFKTSISNICVLPPAHFTTGFALMYLLASNRFCLNIFTILIHNTSIILYLKIISLKN